MTHVHHPLVLSTVRPLVLNKFVWLKLGMSMILISLVVAPVIQNGEGEKLNNNNCYINFLSLRVIDKCKTDKCKHRIQQDNRRNYASFYLVKQEQNTK